ncbi:MAG: hypothetical protein WDZ88_03210 [Candidatus Paceibacterota bacterium]
MIIFLGLMLPRMIEGTLEPHHLQAFGGYIVLIVILGLIPFSSRLEVGPEYVKTYFFWFQTSHIRPSDIIVIEYGKLMRFGGLGFGKGIKAWVKTKNDGKRYFDVGENFYGKEAIAHVRKVLEQK